MTTTTAMTTMDIDGKDYDADRLSDQAWAQRISLQVIDQKIAEHQAQLISLQVTDQKIAEHQAQMAIYQTARAAYGRELLASASTA